MMVVMIGLTVLLQVAKGRRGGGENA